MGLIEDLKNDLEAGVVKMIHEYRDVLFAEAVRLLNDQHEAEDLVFRVFEAILAKIDTYDAKKGGFLSWSKGIMRNEATLMRRGKVAKATIPIDPDELRNLTADYDVSTEKEILLNSDSELLHEAFKTLPKEMQDAMFLHYVSDLSIAEVAKLLKVQPGTVKMRLHRARKFLLHRLESNMKGKKPLAILLALLFGAGALFGAWQAGVAILDNFNANNQTTQIEGEETPKMNTITKLATPLLVATLSTTASAANVTPLTPSDATVRKVETGVYRYDYKGKKVLVFADPGEYQVTLPDNVTSLDYLVVGGGGGGGYSWGGGGGAGGYLESANSLTDVAGAALEITVGAGGAGGTSTHNNGYEGGDSSLQIGSAAAIVAKGGGYGGGNWTTGGDGGSGGGGGGHNGQLSSPGAGTAGQGYAGGSSTSGNVGGGGGGGAGDNGANAAGTYAKVPTSGGAGKASSITGSEVVYAKGGEGGVYYSFGEVGMDGTGNGGGGGAGLVKNWNSQFENRADGKKGGSGIVVLSYTVSGPSPDDPIPLGDPVAYEWGWSNVVETADRYDCVIAFTNPGEHTWTLPQNATDLDYLVVGGGAGGGYNYGGGGGAGGYRAASELLTGVEGAVLKITVGAGGAGGTSSAANGGQGGDSSLQIGDGEAITAKGGGSGGGNWTKGVAGGSGGGNGGYDSNGLSQAAAQGVAGQGNNGGLSSISKSRTYYYGGGGGGGAGGAGATADVESASRVTLGGVGRESSISGKVVEYAKGGAGGTHNATGVAGMDGTGNGGGGGKASVAGLKGGNGIVIIRYPTEPADKATVNFTCDTSRQSFTATVGGQPIVDGAKVQLGSVVTVVVKPNKGYGYKSLPSGWNQGAEPKTITRNFTAEANPLQIDIPDADQLEVFKFKLNTGDHGMVAVSPNEETYYWGDQITLTATPDAGYGFVGWSGSVTGKETTIQITMDGNKEVSATFGFELTILPPEYGVIEGATSGDVFKVGADVVLTVTPNAGYSFVAWGGDASGSAPTTIIKMDRPRTVRASFKDDQGHFMTDWGYSNVVKVAGVKRCVLAFTKVGTHTLPLPSNVRELDYLIVGGGGGGGGYMGGGGGAGGLIAANGVAIAKGTTLSVSVGAGGTGGAAGVNVAGNGGKGSNSTLSYGGTSLSADGGGAGGGGWKAGGNGGSGGGCGCYTQGSGGSATQGNKGGDSLDTFAYGAGGGGAGGKGGDNSDSTPGVGGLGFESFITGESAFYAAGGGGGAYKGNGADGGSGIGGNANGGDGVDGTGSGGGGAGEYGTGGKGGDGIVIVSYPVATRGIVLMIY